MQDANFGYHIRLIPKGVLGEISKIKEEFAEFEDAMEQGSLIMALVELSDMQGAIKAWLAKHTPGVTLDDLNAMSLITERAFRNGRR
ncbi:hypothetical protein HOU03_gp543 [Caulobacter phage CcrSC]|uniref:Uncharacterized protein n=1 Tax=Caulobacter phage CcrSC TaxID=2283272 RepID=A0A385ECW1_9CAUD|nr:hypothetical protein HOU03_gp543 [Caulobacter phage CcrSC]AXQ69724.1 hypothetical protein CcrSC_gp142 [Caulobacter phage CcrSC]